MFEKICLLKFTAKPYINRAAGSVVGPLGSKRICGKKY
jgi:hypothetical protein